jgi:hypothetical protein
MGLRDEGDGKSASEKFAATVKYPAVVTDKGITLPPRHGSARDHRFISWDDLYDAVEAHKKRVM